VCAVCCVCYSVQSCAKDSCAVTGSVHGEFEAASVKFEIIISGMANMWLYMRLCLTRTVVYDETALVKVKLILMLIQTRMTFVLLWKEMFSR